MIRIGQSTDIHQLVKGRKLILGGVEIEHEMGLLGHSDADALLHAIAESILGALALGDLGKHFPDTDERYKDMNSLWMLRQVYKIMEEKGYAIGNLDAMIMLNCRGFFVSEIKPPYSLIFAFSLSTVISISAE